VGCFFFFFCGFFTPPPPPPPAPAIRCNVLKKLKLFASMYQGLGFCQKSQFKNDFGILTKRD